MALGCVTFATTAKAESPTSAQIELRGTISPRCGFTTVPANGDLGELKTGQTTEVGSLAFSCNLASSSAVTLTVQSENGALKRQGGAEKVSYQAAWDIQGRNGDFVDAAPLVPGLSFSLQSGTAGSLQSGLYRIRVTGPTDALVAGTYHDRITYTISP